jgi:hypothetical protein
VLDRHDRDLRRRGRRRGRGGLLGRLAGGEPEEEGRCDAPRLLPQTAQERPPVIQSRRLLLGATALLLGLAACKPGYALRRSCHAAAAGPEARKIPRRRCDDASASVKGPDDGGAASTNLACPAEKPAAGAATLMPPRRLGALVQARAEEGE